MSNRALALVLLAAGLALWWMSSPRSSWRYRMTVEVQTPEGVRSGSAVRKVTYSPRSGFFLAEGRAHWHVKGQAVAVDLPNGKSLYALLRSDGPLDVSYGARVADEVFGDRGRVRGWPGPEEIYPTVPNELLDAHVRSPAFFMPMLVTFADPRRSESVALVDPKNLEASFGAGYSLKRITINIVSRPVTTGIESRLQWLGAHPEPSLKPNHDPLDWSVPAKLKQGDFVRR